ncbi:SMP-30/gluconolactonase/LRE family protein [Rugamonas sp. FT107W]|uniref:SMP-30/gluconolactonase/LRE family protein n=1 Tax=Duganella vulcania TaxID=2692166 RepID=A0A845HEV0_9BURK|nr:SMP-30/gluconolactonase/LRE family protein [Duganella vulcania]MYN17188.1 SMP-30/gluconolactonase/LRE family protein [Duganella vulcania]
MSLTSTSTASTTGILLALAGQAGCALRWDPQAACWRWPDPQGGQLYAWPQHDGKAAGARLLENAGVIACCRSGRMLLGQGKRLGMVELTPAGQPGRPLQAQVLATIDAAEARTVISDGCTDRHGNFVFGTANTGADQRPIGSFYQYSTRHGLRRLALPVVVTARSIAFSVDGTRMYFADAARGGIMQCRYDAERAKVGEIREFAQAPERGAATVDSAGMLWSVQAGGLAQYCADGHLRRRIALEQEQPSGMAFGGVDTRQLLLLGVRGGLYGLPPALAEELAPGVADTPFDDGPAAVADSQRRRQGD